MGRRRKRSGDRPTEPADELPGYSVYDYEVTGVWKMRKGRIKELRLFFFNDTILRLHDQRIARPNPDLYNALVTRLEGVCDAYHLKMASYDYYVVFWSVYPDAHHEFRSELHDDDVVNKILSLFGEYFEWGEHPPREELYDADDFATFNADCGDAWRLGY